MSAKKLRHPDFAIWIAVLFLCFIGAVGVYSAGSSVGYKYYGDPAYYFNKHILFLIASFTCLIIVYAIPTSLWESYAGYFFILAILLGILTLIPGIGVIGGGARRWIEFGSFRLQTSEFMVFAGMLYSCSFCSKKVENLKDFKRGFLPLLLTSFILAGLIFLEPDFGTSIIIVLNTVIIYIISGGSVSYVLEMSFCFIPLIVWAIYKAAYRMDRIMAFWDPWSSPQGHGFQLIQSLIAFAMGGGLGVGLGKGRQKLFYLPASHTDFVFSIIGEEMGLLVCIFIILLYTIIIWRIMTIVKFTDSIFNKLLCFAFGFSIISQVILNIGGVVGMLPMTGVTLPFISYGGSSMMASLVKVGIILRISAETNEKDILSFS